MKKTIFALVVALTVAFTSYAQLIDKGTLMAGGTLEFTTKNQDNVFILNPMLGYAFVDNTMLGASVAYSSITKLSSFSVGPFARYYLNFGLFGHSGLNFSHVESAERENDFDVVLGLGYAAFLNDNVALEPLFTVNLLDGETYTRLGISLQVYFGR
ncbi:MAG: hypothetical protein ACK4TA_06975 [Saprospiraceae bacterium]